MPPELEQQQQQTEVAPPPAAPESGVEAVETAAEAPAEATQDDLVAAAREAMAASKAETKAEPEKPVEQQTEEEPRWQRLVREREKGTAAREVEERAAADIKARAEAEATRIIDEARVRARQVADEEQKAWLKAYQADPESALKQLGGADQVADRLIELNTPHGKAMAAMRAELAEAKAKAAEGGDVRKDFETFKQQQAQEKVQAEFESAKKQFWTHASQEQTPYLHARYDEGEIIQRAALVEKDWREAELQFDYSDIAQYLESEAKKRLTAVGVTPAPQSRAAPGLPAGHAPKSQANGSRTITAAAGSERRAAPRPFNELSAKEQDDDLVRVAREAMRQYGKT